LNEAYRVRLCLVRRTRELSLTDLHLPEIPHTIIYAVKPRLRVERHLPSEGPEMLVELDSEVDPCYYLNFTPRLNRRSLPATAY
jgi:hypothetical protein